MPTAMDRPAPERKALVGTARPALAMITLAASHSE